MNTYNPIFGSSFMPGDGKTIDSRQPFIVGNGMDNNKSSMSVQSHKEHIVENYEKNKSSMQKHIFEAVARMAFERDPAL